MLESVDAHRLIRENRNTPEHSQHHHSYHSLIICLSIMFFLQNVWFMPCSGLLLYDDSRSPVPNRQYCVYSCYDWLCGWMCMSSMTWCITHCLLLIVLSRIRVVYSLLIILSTSLHSNIPTLLLHMSFPVWYYYCLFSYVCPFVATTTDLA